MNRLSLLLLYPSPTLLPAPPPIFPLYSPINAGPNITELIFTPDPVTEGETLMLMGVAQNNHDAPNNLMFIWYHNGTAVGEDSRGVITSSSEDPGTREARSTLVVMNVTRKDGGLYHCIAFNREIADSDEANSLVTVYCKWSALFTVVTSSVNASILSR